MTIGDAVSGLCALRAALARIGGPVSEMLRAEEELRELPSEPGPPQLAAAGPRTRGHELEYELLLEMIYEGSLLHYGRPRVLAVIDPDLALLLGDQLYALGLSRLAALGDVQAVGELADVISLVAQAHARADSVLADAVWSAGAAAVGWGADHSLIQAKTLARQQQPGAAAALILVAAEKSGNIRSAEPPDRVDGKLQPVVRQPHDR